MKIIPPRNRRGVVRNRSASGRGGIHETMPPAAPDAFPLLGSGPATATEPPPPPPWRRPPGSTSIVWVSISRPFVRDAPGGPDAVVETEATPSRSFRPPQVEHPLPPPRCPTIPAPDRSLICVPSRRPSRSARRGRNAAAGRERRSAQGTSRQVPERTPRRPALTPPAPRPRAGSGCSPRRSFPRLARSGRPRRRPSRRNRCPSAP